MLDLIFIVIHHFNKPYKKKDLHYLLSSRLDSSKKENLVISYDININNKCPACKEFNPWILVKNYGEGLFLLKKFIGKVWTLVNSINSRKSIRIKVQ